VPRWGKTGENSLILSKEGFAASEVFLKKARPQVRWSGMFSVQAHPVFIEDQPIPEIAISPAKGNSSRA
jgi:hypothetical protein